MARLLAWLLPGWARDNSALLHYQLAGATERRAACLHAALLMAIIAIAALLIDALALNESNLLARIWMGSRYPLLALQLATLAAAFVLGGAAVTAQRSRKTWDSLRATEAGAALSLRVSWLGALFRLRAPLAVILLVRLVYCLGMLLELPAFGGQYASMLAMQAQPPLTNAQLAPALIGALLAAELLLPLSALGFAAAGGILLAVAVRERVYAAVAQALLLAALLGLVALGEYASIQVASGGLRLSGGVGLALHAAYSAFGDWGLSLAHLRGLGAVWAQIPHSAGIGLALLLLALAQGLAADAMLNLAGALAERRG